MRWILLSLVLAACASSVHAPVAPVAKGPPTIAVEPAAALPVASTDVTFTADGHAVPGTVTSPTAPGRYAGIVLMAGSGPTDRDWNNPLIATKNGSGKLLAEALAAKGAVVLRFDKAAVGGNHAPLASLTIDTYRDEAQAALALLRGRPDVDPAHLFVAGHSEGSLHAIRVALAEGPHLAGVLLLAPPGRTLEAVILDQLDHQLRTALPAQADGIEASLRAAFADFLAGKPVDPARVSAIPGIQRLVAAIVRPDTAALGRALLAFDPAAAIARVTQPVFLWDGAKDIQTDPDLDARHLATARGTLPTDVYIAPDADHVMKHEVRTVAQLRADLIGVQAGYNAPDRQLDGDSVAHVAGWLANHTH
jgi:pimeloyl-ACP methyl ester carboxylesterase